ncbi:MAG: hypothetical protein HZB34_10455 [Nitrospirae bacterium]|nr:hypothetical protein [Nitrospirota bacterium]
MKTISQESQIIASALERLKAVHPLRVMNLRQEINARDRGWDGEVTIKTKGGAYRYLFEVKAHLRPQAIHHLLIRANADRKRWDKTTELLLLADYVNPLLAGQLKNAGINFIDTAGNLFLKRAPELYLYVEGKKPPASQKDKPTRLFQPSGLALLFGLLIEPESINLPYRNLASVNGVALGTVGWVKRDLKEQGYLEPIGTDRFRLIRRKELFERWVQGYASRLRPKLFVGEYRDLTNNLDAVVKTFRRYAVEQGMSWCVTGGVGADAIMHHYQGNMITFFVEFWRQDEALKGLKWLPASGGLITILKSFSPRVLQMSGSQQHARAAHPLLIYAELLHQGTDRDLETARLIYKNYLEESIAKD